jgi:hypothetical protein
VYFQAQPVRLAETSDAGRDWVTGGTELPAAPQSAAFEQVAAVDGARIRAVSGTGKLLVTGNAGATWAAQSLPAPVVVLQGTHPALASTADGGARWTVRGAGRLVAAVHRRRSRR